MNKPGLMLGSIYLESRLYRTWPLFTAQKCTLCGRELRRSWLWKFNPRRKNYKEPRTVQYACFACTSANYNDAVVALDSHFKNIEFPRLRKK